ncbi:hypothetical protein BH11PSE1_BH11PSE1_12490 [soil metagenome]
MFRSALLAGALLAAAPLAADAYEAPLRANDFAPGELATTFVHTSGIQADGKDIGVVRQDGNGVWSRQSPAGADKTVLSNWVVYGKPVYAMASGTVVGCWRNAPENVPGSYLAEYQADKIPGAGNHLWIRQDDGVYALYAHMQPGSIPASLCPHNNILLTDTSDVKGGPSMRTDAVVVGGARVTVGQAVGKVGNAGASKGGPHLHVHMEKAGKPVPLTFDRGMTTPNLGAKSSLNGPWTPLKGKEMPKADILLWPPRIVSDYTFNGIKDENYQRLVEHMADSGMMPKTISCAGNGATYNSQWVPAVGQWGSHHGMSAAELAAKDKLYVTQGYKKTSTFTCGSVNVAVWRK